MLDVKRPIRINFRLYFKSKHLSSNVDIEFHNGKSYIATNYIDIESSDIAWVNSTLAEIDEIMASSKPQKHFMVKNSSLLTFGVFLSSAYIVGTLLSFILGMLVTPSPDEQKSWLSSLVQQYYFVKVLARMIILGGIPASFITSWFQGQIEKLWPDIEIQVGPAHTYIEENRRDFLRKAASIALAPSIGILIELFIF